MNVRSSPNTECVLQKGGVTNVLSTKDRSLVINKSIHVPSVVVKLVGQLTRFVKFCFFSIDLNLDLWFDNMLTLKSPTRNKGFSFESFVYVRTKQVPVTITKEEGGSI